MQEEGNMVFSFIGAIIILLISIFLKMNLAFMIILPIITYFGIYWFTRPTSLSEELRLEYGSELGKELISIYRLGLNGHNQLLKHLSFLKQNMDNLTLVTMTESLAKKSSSIISLLSKKENSQLLSESEYFFRYYYEKIDSIFNNYRHVRQSGASTRLQDIALSEALESIEYLNRIFGQQLDKYYNNSISELKSDSDFLAAKYKEQDESANSSTNIAKDLKENQAKNMEEINNG